MLPIMRTMFFGHTTTECQEDEASIMRILSSPKANRQKMMEFVQELRENYCPADLSCILDNATSMADAGHGHAVGGLQGVAPLGAQDHLPLPRLHEGLQPGRALAQALHRLLRWVRQGGRPVLQPGD